MIKSYDAVKRAVHEAGNMAMEYFGRLSSLSVTEKGHLDLVSEADREIEKFLTAAIMKEFPDDGILGEEGADRKGRSGRVWVLDPIDGTFNFLRGRSCWVVSVGVFANNRPEFGIINAPVRKQFFSGGPDHGAECNGIPLEPVKKFNPLMGIMNIEFHPDLITLEQRLDVLHYVMQDMALTFRHNGCAAMSLMEVALGEVDAYLGLGESSWDVMGALPILSALGYQNSINWTETALSDKLRFFSAKSELVPLLAALLKKVGVSEPH